MSRLDNFDEILKNYEGRDYDSLAGLLKECISRDARDVYDSLSPELQRKILKYFDCVKQTGLIKWPSAVERFDCRELAEANPDYFDHYLLDAGNLEENELKEFSGRLDQTLKLYEPDMPSGESK